MFKTLLVLFCVNSLYFKLVIAKTREQDSHETKCSNEDCSKDCKKLNYTSGSCFNNTLCYCDEEGKGPTQYDSIKTKCEKHVCVTDCHELGYPGGKCVDADICFCDPKTKGNKTDSNESNESCYLHDCKLSCRDEGYYTGVCLTNTCYCNNTNTTNEPTKPPKVLASSIECVRSQCNRDCQSLNYLRGFCAEDDGLCYCEFEGSMENPKTKPTSSTEKPTSKPTMTCKDYTCDRACKDQSFISGSCSKNECNCISQVECKDQRCKVACTDDGFSGGECRAGDCYCKPKRINSTGKPKNES